MLICYILSMGNTEIAVQIKLNRYNVEFILYLLLDTQNQIYKAGKVFIAVLIKFELNGPIIFRKNSNAIKIRKRSSLISQYFAFRIFLCVLAYNRESFSIKSNVALLIK